MKFFEWVREGSPDYVKNKKKEALEAKLAGLRSAFKDISMEVGPAASHLDAPDEARLPEDARRRDDLADQIAEVERQIKELG